MLSVLETPALQDSIGWSKNGFLSSTEEVIEEACNGRMFILVDDEDPDNGGNLVIPGQMATPEAVNFMARYGRGLICLALSKARVDELDLQLMTPESGSRRGTAFTVSIEAHSGVTTGISAADRARTIAVAIDSANGPSEIVTPGHVFPLVARDGGVLVCAGHTEAAVDIARLAGLNASGVICAIMNEDGAMARMDDLFAFAQLHDLRIGTLRDLIAYRRRNDRTIERVSSKSISSEYGGAWEMITYRNRIDGAHSLVLRKGEVQPGEPALVRVHALSFFADVLGSPGPRRHALQRAMLEVDRHGSGLIVLVAAGESGLLSVSDGAGDTPADMDLRGYGIGAQILADMGVEDMILLTGTHRHIVGLEGFGINVVAERPIVATLD